MSGLGWEGWSLLLAQGSSAPPARAAAAPRPHAEVKAEVGTAAQRKGWLELRRPGVTTMRGQPRGQAGPPRPQTCRVQLRRPPPWPQSAGGSPQPAQPLTRRARPAPG